MNSRTVSGKRYQYIAAMAYTIAVMALLVWSLGPVAWSFVVSIMPQVEMQTTPASLWPAHPTLENYRMLLMSGGDDQGALFRKGMTNALIAATLSVLVTVPISAIGAYALTRMRFRGREAIRIGLLITLVIPVFATIIPLYQMFAAWGLLDTFIGVVAVYVSAFLPLTVWLISSYFVTLPKELEEAAMADGCSELRALWSVILPSSYPVLLSAALIVFLSAWNQFLIPLILSPSPATKPVAVVASEFVTKTTMNYGLMNAGGVLAVLPPAIIALVFRRFLVQGLVAGATKG